MNIGMIGTNFISDNFVEAARQVGGFQLYSLYSRRLETGHEFGDKYGIEHIHDHLETFLADDKLDAVYIASPNALHCGQAIGAINHGKHVLVEKPIASHSRELAEMEAAAKKNHVVLMEAMRAAYLPGYDWIRNNLSRIGTVRNVQFQFCQYSRRYDRFKAGEVMNAFNPDLSNAALMDIGVYGLHTFLMLFGRPEEVKASSVKLSNGMEGAGSVILSYPEMVGSLTYSKITDGTGPSIILGEEGSITLDHLSQLRRITLFTRDGETDEYIDDGPSNNMCHELEMFKKLVQFHDQDITGGPAFFAPSSLSAGGQANREKDVLKTTRLCLEVMDEIRRQSGIHFPADDQVSDRSR